MGHCALAVPVRTHEQIEGTRQACFLARKILDAAHAAVRPGVTTDEIDRVVRFFYGVAFHLTVLVILYDSQVSASPE